MLHPPIDAHWLVANRGNIIHQAETIEGTCIAKAVPLILSYEQEKLLLVFSLLHETKTPSFV